MQTQFLYYNIFIFGCVEIFQEWRFEEQLNYLQTGHCTSHLIKSSHSKVSFQDLTFAKYLLIVLQCIILILLHDFMQPGLHLLLAVSQRVAVAVQQSVHVGTLHHLDQDRCQLSL